jgi:hypothetical protein
MTMDTTAALIAFYRAQLDEEETAAANTAPSGCRWSWRTDVQTDDDGHVVGHCVVSDPDAAGVAGAWGLERGTGQAVAEHIARQDPASTLGDIAADRKLLVNLEAVAVRTYGGDWSEGEAGYADGIEAGLLVAVKIRAERFSGHPDYSLEWKP